MKISYRQEIVKYKRNLQDPDISARDLPQDVIEFFQHHLVTQPYPTWEILYHIIDIRSHDKNRLLDELLIKALSNLIDAIIKHPEQLDKRDKLYNLLSNIYISEWCMNKIRSIIIPRLYDLKENRGLLDESESSKIIYLLRYQNSHFALFSTFVGSLIAQHTHIVDSLHGL